MFSANELRDRTNQALADYIGDRAPVMMSIELICRQISAVKSQHFIREPELPIDPPTLEKDKERELEI
jgi:hypothetical protein